MKKAPSCITIRTVALATVMLALLTAWGLFHRDIQHALTGRLLLRSNNPNPDAFADYARNSEDPVGFLERCWATGKVAHRQLVASLLKDSAAAHSPWIGRVEPLLLACATDADASVRELGLAALDQLRSPHLFEAASLQLNDLDPLVRRFGLDYLRRSNPTLAAPLLIHALDDPDLRNVAAAENALVRLSGQDFGVRARQAIPPQDNGNSGTSNSTAVETIRRGVEQRKLWWREHHRDYTTNGPSTLASAALHSQKEARPPAPDFSLPNLAGKRIKLSDFKGKVVLVNFWATWCTACLKEIPDLVALQDRLGDKVVILGIALDGVPDEDGDDPGQENEVEKQNASARQSVRAKVERAVKLRRINYPVLLDPKGVVGGQYNGGELPTTVVFDAEGRVRRRFIGERTLAVFEAMLAEAGKPPGAIRNSLSIGSNDLAHAGVPLPHSIVPAKQFVRSVVPSPSQLPARARNG